MAGSWNQKPGRTTARISISHLLAFVNRYQRYGIPFNDLAPRIPGNPACRSHLIPVAADGGAAEAADSKDPRFPLVIPAEVLDPHPGSVDILPCVAPP